MGGLISVLINVFAGLAFFNTGHPYHVWVCCGTAALALWSWGIMHNFATLSAKRRSDHVRRNMAEEGASQTELERLDDMPIQPGASDYNEIPNWISVVNMLATFAGLALLIWGVVVRWF
jgi:hypothetical protein